MPFDPVEVAGYVETFLGFLDGPIGWVLGLGAAAYVFRMLIGFMRGNA